MTNLRKGRGSKPPSRKSSQNAMGLGIQPPPDLRSKRPSIQRPGGIGHSRKWIVAIVLALMFIVALLFCPRFQRAWLLAFDTFGTKPWQVGTAGLALAIILYRHWRRGGGAAMKKYLRSEEIRVVLIVFGVAWLGWILFYFLWPPPEYSIKYTAGGRMDGFIHRLEIHPNARYGMWRPGGVCIPIKDKEQVKPDVRQGLRNGDSIQWHGPQYSENTVADLWCASITENFTPAMSIYLFCATLPNNMKIGLSADGREFDVDLSDMLTPEEWAASTIAQAQSRFSDTNTFIARGPNLDVPPCTGLIAKYKANDHLFYDIIMYVDHPATAWVLYIPYIDVAAMEPGVQYGYADRPPQFGEQSFLSFETEAKTVETPPESLLPSGKYFLIKGLAELSGAKTIHITCTKLPSFVYMEGLVEGESRNFRFVPISYVKEHPESSWE